MTTKVRCPTCGKEIEWKPENRWRPFCCERCQLIDLGAWADEKYAIPTQEPTSPFDEQPEQNH